MYAPLRTFQHFKSKFTQNHIIKTPHAFKLYASNSSSANKSFDSQKLLSAIADLERYDIRLRKFPTMVFFGPQSSGKSSTIQAILGNYLLPTDMKMATKKPTHITTIRSQINKYKIGDREFSDIKLARDEIERVNNNDVIKKIDIVVYGPNVHNCMLIDLPGLFSISDDSTNFSSKEVKKMSLAYISNHNLIPVIVHSAPSDLATNTAMKLISDVNRRNDALGILTKIDMVENQKTEYLEKILNGAEYKLGYGYCAVILPNDKDIERGITVEDKIIIEANYLKKYPNIHPAGVPTLRKMISDIQAKKIIEFIPQILVDVDSQIKSLNDSNIFLNEMMGDDHKKLSANLRIMIEKLVGSSQERAEFENELRKRLDAEVRLCLTDVIEKNTELSHTNEKINDNILKLIKVKNVSVEDNFKSIFNTGSKSAVFIDNFNLEEAFNNERILGLSLSLMKLHVNDNLGFKRVNWHKQILEYIDKLLKDDNIHKIIKTVTSELLLEYIFRESEFDDPISKKFAEYMIDEISSEAFESKIKYSITAMLNLEKRPNISVFELLRYFVTKHPKILQMPSSLFFSYAPKYVQLEIYSQDWIDSYKHVLINSIIDNCYRNIAVNLVDKMVEKLLEMTFEVLNKENRIKEQNKINEKIKKMMEIKEILTCN